jgi:hypothetical protein
MRSRDITKSFVTRSDGVLLGVVVRDDLEVAATAGSE